MMLELTNKWHDTSISIRAQRKDLMPNALYISKWQIRKARKALCNKPGCKCGGELGETPWIYMYPAYCGGMWIPCFDGKISYVSK